MKIAHSSVKLQQPLFLQWPPSGNVRQRSPGQRVLQEMFFRVETRLLFVLLKIIVMIRIAWKWLTKQSLECAPLSHPHPSTLGAPPRAQGLGELPDAKELELHSSRRGLQARKSGFPGSGQVSMKRLKGSRARAPVYLAGARSIGRRRCSRGEPCRPRCPSVGAARRGSDSAS